MLNDTRSPSHDGIDFDFHRARARQLRAEAMQEFASRNGMRKAAAAAAIALGIVTLCAAGLALQGDAAHQPASVANSGITVAK